MIQSVYAHQLTNMRPISHALKPKGTVGEHRSAAEIGFCVSGVPFAPRQSSAAMFLPADEQRECANWQAGAGGLPSGSPQTGSKGNSASRSRYGRPEEEDGVMRAVAERWPKDGYRLPPWLAIWRTHMEDDCGPDFAQWWAEVGQQEEQEDERTRQVKHMGANGKAATGRPQGDQGGASVWDDGCQSAVAVQGDA